MRGSAGKRETKVHEIAVHRSREGLRWVFLAEVETDSQSLQVARAIEELAGSAQVRMLCTGRLVACVVQASSEQADLLLEFEDFLKVECSFVAAHRSFDDVIWQVARDLAMESGSTLHEVPSCDICGRPEPFPTVTLTLTDREGGAIAQRNYCGHCSAQPSVSNHKGFVRTLLKSEKEPISGSDRWDLVRRPSHKRLIRFRVVSGSNAS